MGEASQAVGADAVQVVHQPEGDPRQAGAKRQVHAPYDGSRHSTQSVSGKAVTIFQASQMAGAHRMSHPDL